jgi:hypothetical protein
MRFIDSESAISTPQLDITGYVRTRARINRLHRLSMIDDAQEAYPSLTRGDIQKIVDFVIDDFCR